MKKILSGLALCLLISGCTHSTGKNFVQPQSNQIIMGRTTKAEVIAVYGEPDRQTTFVKTDSGNADDGKKKTEFDVASVDGSFENIFYRFTEIRQKDGFGLVSGKLNAKSIRFVMWNGKVVSYTFSSDFESGSSDFDSAKIEFLKKGQMQKSDVVTLMGEPSGKAVYPVVQTVGNELFIYAYDHIDPNTRKISSKVLIVLFDSKGQLIDYRFGSDTHDLPASPAPAGAVPVPIIIPAHK